MFSLEPASRKSEIRVVLPFRGLSTVRAGAEVKGVAVGELGGQVSGKERAGRPRSRCAKRAAASGSSAVVGAAR